MPAEGTLLNLILSGIISREWSCNKWKTFGKKPSPTYLCRPLKRPVRLRARTPPFHGGDTGSNPVRATVTPSVPTGTHWIPANLWLSGIFCFTIPSFETLSSFFGSPFFTKSIFHRYKSTNIYHIFIFKLSVLTLKKVFISVMYEKQTFTDHIADCLAIFTNHSMRQFDCSGKNKTTHQLRISDIKI